MILKFIYDDKSEDLKKSLENTTFINIENKEFLNINSRKDSKNAHTLKSYYGAKKNPFAVVMDGEKVIKTFYSENKGCTFENIQIWDNILYYINNSECFRVIYNLRYSDDEFSKYVKNAPCGKITIWKVSDNIGNIEKNYIYDGYTPAFTENITCLVSGVNWIKTSIVQIINWKKNEFKTLNSTYKFKFIPLI